MTQTISKHIGEGFGKGDLYAALAYDTNDVFGGLRIKSLYIAKTISSDNAAGSEYGFQILTQTDNLAARSIGSLYGMKVEAKLQHESDNVSGLFCGAFIAIDPCDSHSPGFAYPLYLKCNETGTRYMAPRGWICFDDADYAGGKPIAHALDFGGAGMRLPTGTGKIYYNETIKILVKNSNRWMPLSTAQGTYTSAYPVILTNATAIAITTDIVDAWTYPFSVKAAFTDAANDYYSAAARVRLTIEGNTDITEGFATAIRAELRIEGDGSSTALSSTGLFAGVEGRYYTDNTDGIAITGGVHCGLAAQMLAGQYYVLSLPADYCGLAVADFTHASATIPTRAYSGIYIFGYTNQNMGNAIKVHSHVTNFLEIIDNDAIAGADSNTATAGNPDGFIRISIGGSTQYIWTYTNKA